ncbi:AhpC/TSA family protein [Mucilaginibacter sp. BJC16-A38]|uniref:TlpA disulfide reductase family protein n=1 Tax=Mucilaginibacter phenanthrenivorans TaxID=1234842 RepID=UPI002157CF12|nr:TlpA disulfide reductase family protein [Mucilaginibacter phenanthrenivorans]MCR8557202.1 AhpC/TSA family protein [Mucilaginibacter phenanthrenivorans]
MANYITKSFIVLFCMVYISAFGQVKKREFLISGSIECAGDITLYISQFDASFNPTHRDSIQTKNGKFTYQVKADHPALMYIYSPKIVFQEKIIFLVSQRETKIHINTNDWDAFFVSGSAQTNAYFNFVKQYEHALFLFNVNSRTIRLPKFKRDTVDGKAKLRVIPTYNCYLLKTDTFKVSDTTKHQLSGKMMDYGRIACELEEEISPGYYVIKRYGDSAETYWNKIIYRHLALNKNSEAGAIIAYEHFADRKPYKEAMAAYQMLSAYSQNTLYGKSLKRYIDLNTIKKKIDFVFPDQTGKLISLSSLSSRYILVHFWASWCGPCRPANKQLVTLYQKYNRDQLEYVNISFDQNKADWQKAIKTDSLPGYHTSQLKGFDNDNGRLFNVRSLPSSFLLDSDRNIILINPYDVSYIEDKLQYKK